jgi:aspartate aminotransferase-like enzyme
MNRKRPSKRIFTPGPVKMSSAILKIGAHQPQYFRNQSFSELFLDCEAKLLALVNAPPDSRVIFLTASGTAAMEAVVTNILDPAKAVAVVNGGSFGQRFVDICNVHGIPIKELIVDRDSLSDCRILQQALPTDALLINGHETSIGHLYDLNCVGCFCKKNNVLHIVDAISMFVTDPLDMQAQNIDVLILSSQKGLALPPGMAFVILTPKSLSRLQPSKSFYFDFQSTYEMEDEDKRLSLRLCPYFFSCMLGWNS